MRTLAIFLTIATGILLSIGCAGSGVHDGILPTSDPQTQTAPSGPRVLWGFWHVYMDPGSSEMTVVPLRGAEFTANVNNLLEGKSGNLLITDLDLTKFQTEGRLDCTVTLKHPFPGLDQYDGFDVWGVFMHNGASSINYDALTYGGGPAAGQNEGALLNPDGYTRWFNQPEFDGNGSPLFEFTPGKLANLPTPTAKLNPYKIFADGLDTNVDYYQWISSPSDSKDRGIFRAGASHSRRYQLQFPIIGGTPKVDFQYAVVATWEPGDPTLTGNPATYEPGDFPSSANVEEPFFVHMSTGASDLYNDGAGNSGGSFKADVEMFDWQGGAVGHNGVPNEINRIIIEANFLPGGQAEFSQTQLGGMAVAGSENSSVFQVDIPNCTPPSSGDAKLWAIVESAGLNGASYGQGFPTAFPAGARRAAFAQGTVAVGTQPPLPQHTYHWQFDTIDTFAGVHWYHPESTEFDDICPAIAEESDGDIGLTWSGTDTNGVDNLYDSHFWVRHSTDNGNTYIGETALNTGMNGLLRVGRNKIAADFIGQSYGTSSFDASDSNMVFFGNVESDYNNTGIAPFLPALNNEIFVDADGWIYLFGDDGMNINSKHSVAPNTVPPINWQSGPYPMFPVANGAFCSGVRSAGMDSSKTVWIVYYDSAKKKIGLAHSTGPSPHESWSATTTVYSAGAGFSQVMDPCLFIDGSDIFHVCYSRFNSNTNKYQLVYVKDDSSFTTPEEKVMVESATAIDDGCISAGFKYGMQVIIFAYENNKSVYMVTLLDGVALGTPQEIDGSTNDISPDAILDKDQCDFHSVWSTMDGDNYDIARRNGVLVQD